MSTDAFKSWENFLNPDKLKQNLIQASVYLTAYEILKSIIIDRIQDFYTTSYQLDEATGQLVGKINSDYREKVIKLYLKDELQACCLWLVSMDAID